MYHTGLYKKKVVKNIVFLRTITNKEKFNYFELLLINEIKQMTLHS